MDMKREDLINAIGEIDGKTLYAHEGMVWWPVGSFTLDGFRQVFNLSNLGLLLCSSGKNKSAFCLFFYSYELYNNSVC